MKPKEIYIELVALLILTAIIALLIYCMTFFSSSTFKEIVLPVMITYIFSAVALILLERKLSNRTLKTIATMYVFPFTILYAVILLIFPFLTLMANWILYFLLAYTLPFFLFFGLNKLHWIDGMRPQTITYLSITLTVFISVLLNQPLRFFVNLLTTRRHKNSKKLSTLELDKISNYTLSVDNVRFMVYFFYVIILIMNNVTLLQSNSISVTADQDRIIIQSFVTFIAFDRAFGLMKQLKFRPSELLEKIAAALKRKLENDQAEVAEPKESSNASKEDAN